MKKIVLVLAMLTLAAPAWAAVTVDAEQTPDTNEVVISYTADVNLPRAFALDISVGGPNVSIGAPYDLNGEYYIYPGSIVIVSGVVQDYGTPVATSDNNSMTLEMGSLYADDDPCHTAPPPSDGVLCRFIVDGNACEENFIVTIEENAERGGVVMENPDEDPDLTLTGCEVELPADCDCFPEAYTQQYTDFLTYVANGWNADCWCAPPEGAGYQCDGDADGLTEGFMKYRVYVNDFNILVANWAKKMGPPGTGADPCADFDHQAEGFMKYRVYVADFNILVANWAKKDTALPGDCPRP